MSIEVWLATGREVSVGGRKLVMMPLPLKRLYKVIKWIEATSLDVVHDTAKSAKPGEVPNPLTLVTTVLMKVDVSEVAMDIFSIPKDLETGDLINKNLTKEFFDDALTIPVAHTLFKEFVALNDIEELIKNLQSLPVVRKIMEAAQLTFGIPYLNSLQQSTVSAQSKLEGSHSHKSMDTSTRSSIAEQVYGQEAKTEEEPTDKKPVVM